MFHKLKDWILKIDKNSDYILTTPMLLTIIREPIIRSKIEKISSRIYSKYPFLKEALCKNKLQKSVAMCVILLILMIICLMLGENINPIALFGAIPYWDYNSFYSKCEDATNQIVAYYSLIVIVAAIDIIFNKCFERFVIGNDDENHIDKILKWMINLYLCAIANSLLTPIAIWYAYNPMDDNAGLFKYSSLSGLIMIISTMAVLAFFEDAFENIGAIYISILAFKVFTTLGLHYVFIFLMFGVNYLLHYEVFKDINGALCLILVVLMQLVIDKVKKLKLYKQFIKILKFLTTTIGGLICFLLCSSLIMVICIIVIYVTRVML